MSLRLWLPLDGSTRNLGISDRPVTGAPSSWGTGMTGKCATFSNNSSDRVITEVSGSDPLYFTNQDFSWCMWLKKDYSSKTATNMWAFTVGRNNADGGYGYGARVYNETRIRCIFGTAYVSVVYNDNEWHHVAFTRTGTTMRVYVDGVLTTTKAITESDTLPTYDGTDVRGIGIGGFRNSSWAYPLIGGISDFRIYDHVLSAKEVSDIAKGLLLHVPFYGGYSGVGNNICTGWKDPQTKNLGGSYTSLITDENFFGLSVGDTFTYRLKITSPSTKGVKARIQYYTDTNTRTSDTSSITVAAGATGYSYVTATLTEAKRAYSKMQLMITNANTSVTSSDPVVVSEVKLERGTVATPWSPLDPGTEYVPKDCSGRGTTVGVTGSLPTVSGDGPRYGMSTLFDGTASCLWPISDPISQSTPEFTISVWFKTMKVSGNQCIWNGRSTTGKAVAIFLVGNKVRFDDSSQTSLTESITADTWYHLAVTWKAGGNKVIYLNGVQKSSVSAGTLDKTNAKASVGRSSAADSLASSNYFSGRMCDLRVYGTALTADQVAALYSAPISVSDRGDVVACQFSEGASGISFAKTGVVSSVSVSSLPGKYDSSVLIEPDGSCWAHVFHHADPTTYKFESTDSFSTGVWKDSRRFLDGTMFGLAGSWEFILVQKADASSNTYRYRWKQYANPNTAAFADVAAANVTKKGTADGYSAIDSGYGGLYVKNSSTYYAANSGRSSSWWGAVGSWTAHNGGIPGYNGIVIKDGGFMDLYMRIDGVAGISGRNGCSLDMGGRSVLARNFIEQ